MDIAELIRERGMKTVMVTNGFINIKPLETIIEVVDAFNVDLKGFTEDFYRRITFASLEPVKKALSAIRRSGRHLEITTLIIPGLNDDKNKFREMIEWICGEVGETTPLHLSRYFPMHRMNLPATPLSTLKELHSIASERMPYVYLGNVGYQDEGRDTICRSCGATAIHRAGYDVDTSGIKPDGNCRHCGEKVVKAD
jgi:pyruvate formate lyase activating enzyme